MSRRALIILLAGLPMAAPAHGQAIYRVDPPIPSEEYPSAHRRHPQFRSETSRHKRRYETPLRSEDGRRGQGSRQETDGEATENQIARLQNENAALKKEFASRVPEDRGAALESQVARLQTDNAALKKELAARIPDDRRVALESQTTRLQNENVALKMELAARLPDDRRAALESQNTRLQNEYAALKRELLTGVAKDRAILEDENARLLGENAALKKDLSAHRLSTPYAGRTEPPASGPGQQGKYNAGLDHGSGFIEKAWRRLIEVIGNLKRG